MMLRRSTLALLMASVAVWSCSRSPASPTPTPSVGALDVLTKGKPPSDPPPPPPPDAVYTMTLGPSIHDDPTSVYPGDPSTFPDGSQDGLPSPGYLSLASPASLMGVLTGPTSNGYFTGELSGGALSGLTISNVEEYPDWYSDGDPCQASDLAELQSRGLVGPGTSVSAGSVTLSLSEVTIKGGPGARGTLPNVTWTLDGVMDNQGGLWVLSGRSGTTRHNVLPVFEPGSSTDHLTVTVENSAVDFLGPSFNILKCRVDFTMTLTKIP